MNHHSSVSFQRKWTLKQKDFLTSKMMSPHKQDWLHCDCCGKLIVQGVELTNGDKIGNDCEEARIRVQRSCRGAAAEIEALKKTFGLLPVVVEYLTNLYVRD